MGPWRENDRKNTEFQGLNVAKETVKNVDGTIKKSSKVKRKVDSQQENKGNFDNNERNLWTTEEMSRKTHRQVVQHSSEKEERQNGVDTTMHKKTEERNQSKNIQKRQPNAEMKKSPKSTRKIQEDGGFRSRSVNATEFDGSSHEVSSTRRFMSYSDILKKKPEVQVSYLFVIIHLERMFGSIIHVISLW